MLRILGKLNPISGQARVPSGKRRGWSLFPEVLCLEPRVALSSFTEPPDTFDNRNGRIQFTSSSINFSLSGTFTTQNNILSDDDKFDVMLDPAWPWADNVTVQYQVTGVPSSGTSVGILPPNIYFYINAISGTSHALDTTIAIADFGVKDSASGTIPIALNTFGPGIGSQTTDLSIEVYASGAYSSPISGQVGFTISVASAASPSMTLDSSPNPSVYGQPVTFSATVPPATTGAPPPTGMVTFKDGSTVIGTGDLNASGIATFTTPPARPLRAGVHSSITAEYGGNSATLTPPQVVSKATPTVIVSDAGGTSNGMPFPATATVAGVVANVDDKPAASLEGVPVTLTYYAGGTASGNPLSAPPSAAGTYTVVANFAGSADYIPRSATKTFVIKPKAPTPAFSTVTLTPLPGDAASGDLAGFSYTVSTAPLSADVFVAAYWATGPTLASVLSAAPPRIVFTIKAGTETDKASAPPSPVILKQADLGTPPPTAKYLILFASPANPSPLIKVTTNPVVFRREFDPQVFLKAFAQALPAPPNPRFADLAIAKAILRRAQAAKTPSLRKYYQNLRSDFISSYTSTYTAQRTAGIVQLLIDMESDPNLTDRRWVAYMLATTYHETAKHMTPWEEDPGVLRTYWPKNSPLPIAEPNLAYFKQYAGRNGNAAWPLPRPTPDAVTYRGRGYIQVTFKNNYEYYDYASDPNEVLNPTIAYVIMSRWMIDGDNPSNAHPLKYYIHDNITDYFDARAMINGDKNKIPKGSKISNGQLIAEYAQIFDMLLSESLDYVPY